MPLLDLNHLLDLYLSDLPLAHIAEALQTTVTIVLDALEHPTVRALLDRMTKAQAKRAQDLALMALPQAVATLEQTTANPTHPESARKAANSIIKLARPSVPPRPTSSRSRQTHPVECHGHVRVAMPNRPTRPSNRHQANESNSAGSGSPGSHPTPRITPADAQQGNAPPPTSVHHYDQTVRRGAKVPPTSDNQNADPQPPAFVRLTGPSFDADAQPPTSTCETPTTDEPEVDQTAERAGVRLLMALLILLGLAAVGLVLALVFDIVVPPIMWFAMVALLIVGVIAGGASEDHKPPQQPKLGDNDGARPIGCCSGPRPLRSFKDR